MARAKQQEYFSVVLVSEALSIMTNYDYYIIAKIALLIMNESPTHILSKIRKIYILCKITSKYYSFYSF
jgi:hypothetical protein